MTLTKEEQYDVLFGAPNYNEYILKVFYQQTKFEKFKYETCNKYLFNFMVIVAWLLMSLIFIGSCFIGLCWLAFKGYIDKPLLIIFDIELGASIPLLFFKLQDWLR